MIRRAAGFAMNVVLWSRRYDGQDRPLSDAEVDDLGVRPALSSITVRLAPSLAEVAARTFGLDYTVVDLVECDGGFLIYEVSAFGGFRCLMEGTGVDPSVAYAAHVVNELGGRR